jgi:hypothetical protein
MGADRHCARKPQEGSCRHLPTLKIGTRTYNYKASNGLVVREADRMFKLSPQHRAHRLETAKTQLARAAAAKSGKNHAPPVSAMRAAAIILSQNITEI